MPEILPYQDPAHEGNSAKYHTGKPCIDGCGRPAGTWWSKLWCFECNVKRMTRIDNSLRTELARLTGKEPNRG